MLVKGVGGVGGQQIFIRACGQNLPTNAGDMKHGFSPWVGKIPWRRKWQPTLVFLPGKSHGQRNLVGYSPKGPKEMGKTEAT